MRESLMHICDKFSVARGIIKSALPMENAYIYPLCAVMLAGADITPTEEHLKELRGLIKQNTGVFSTFRGITRPVIIASLYINEAHKTAAEGLSDIIGAHTALKEYFWDSQYLPLAALFAVHLTGTGELEEICVRTGQLYELMKKRHSIITSSDDVPSLTLLAGLKRECEDIEDQAEACYRLLKPEFSSHNSVQALSCVLTYFEGKPEEKARGTLALYDEFKRRDRRYGTFTELATLGALAMLPNTEGVISDVLEVDAHLEEQGGYGAVLGLGGRQRLMHAGMLVINERVAEASESERDICVKARDAALCAAICSAASTSQNGN